MLDALNRDAVAKDTVGLDLFFGVSFDGLYHGKSPLNHHLG